MNKPVTEGWLMKEFTARAKACQLKVDCLGSGVITSEICVIGEAPGEHEANMKMPMVGGAGKLLWDTLHPLDITRKDCYVTNVVKAQVSLSSKVDARNPVKKSELEHWEGLLDWELDHLPNLRYLNLSYNELGLSPHIHNITFRHLRSLQVLDISCNNISHINSDMFSDMKNLTTLDIRGNTIHVISSSIIGTLSHLAYFSLANNKFNYFSLDVMDAINRVTEMGNI